MDLTKVNFLGAASRPFHDFRSCYDEYAAQNFKEFVLNEQLNEGHVYLIPPIFSYKFTQPAILASYPKPSGALPKLKDGTRQNLGGELAEHKVFEVIEQFYMKSKMNVLIVHGFTIDNLKREMLKSIFPELILVGFETDFIIFIDNGIVINIEVKSVDIGHQGDSNPKQQERKFTEARNQLRVTEKVLMTLSKYFNIPCELSTIKIVVMPNVLYKPTKLVTDVPLLSGETWQKELEHQLNLSRDIVEKDRVAIKELAKIVCAIKVLEVVTNEGTEWISISKSSRLSVVALEESKKVQEHQVIKDLTAKLESNMQRTSKRIVLEQSATEKKLTLYDVLKVYFLTPEQMLVWEAANKRQILAGVAGTGKTLLLLGRTNLLLAMNEKVIFIGTDSMQNKLKNYFCEQSSKAENLTMLSPHEFLLLPEIRPLKQLASKLYNRLFTFIEERLTLKIRTDKHFFNSMHFESNSNAASFLNSNEKKRVSKCLRHITDFFADTFRELAEDDPDPAHSISHPSGKRGEVLDNFISFYDIDVSDLKGQIDIISTFFADKNIMIDDLLSLSSSTAVAECGFFWLLVSFLFPHCTNSEKYCWIAMDYMQMLVQETLARCVCQGVDTVFNLLNLNSWLSVDEKLNAEDDPTCASEQRAVLYERLLMEALIQITALFDAPTIFAKKYFTTNLLGTVMRCTTKVFDTWKSTYASALTETSLDGTMIAASVLCTGHRFVGVEPRCITARDLPEGLKQIRVILEKEILDSAAEMKPCDIAILVMENDTRQDVLFHYFYNELSVWLATVDVEVCHMVDQPLHRNAIAVGRASESASQEWTLVILITDVIQDDEMLIQKYLGLSRCIEWLITIRIIG